MNSVIIFLLCFTILCCSLSVADTGVKGYSTTDIQNFPYQVTVQVDKKPVCSGAIVGDYWVLTARSCVPANASEVDRVKIRAGTSVLGRGGAYHVVSKITKYYEKASYFGVDDSDVALIKVVSPFTYASNIQWISPDVNFLTDDQDIIVSGWGIHNLKAEEKNLHKSTVKLIPNDQCEHHFANILNITKEMACLVPASENDNPCIADVGAPISVRGLISAVVSNNEHCWKDGLPLVVTNIGKIGWFIAFTLSEPLLRYGPIF